MCWCLYGLVKFWLRSLLIMFYFRLCQFDWVWIRIAYEAYPALDDGLPFDTTGLVPFGYNHILCYFALSFLYIFMRWKHRLTTVALKWSEELPIPIALYVFIKRFGKPWLKYLKSNVIRNMCTYWFWISSLVVLICCIFFIKRKCYQRQL